MQDGKNFMPVNENCWLINKTLICLQIIHMMLLINGYSRRIFHFLFVSKLYSSFFKIPDKTMLLLMPHFVIPILAVRIESIKWKNWWWLMTSIILVVLLFYLIVFYFLFQPMLTYQDNLLICLVIKIQIYVVIHEFHHVHLVFISSLYDSSNFCFFFNI